MLNEPYILAFVCGSEEEKEKQKSEIQKYCKERHCIDVTNIKFISDWDMLEKELKDAGTIIITDIRVLSGDCDEIVKKLFCLMIKHHNFVSPVNKEQYKKLEHRQYNKYPEGWPENRILAELEMVCREILKGNDDSTTQTT